MQQISFHSPSSVGEACEMLADQPHDTNILAGGQSLIQMLKQRLVGASRIVDLGELEELAEVRVTDDRVWIGAARTYANVREHAGVRERLPVLPEMIATIGDEQIRNRGTLVGGIAHADPQGDPPVLATALDATLRIRSFEGERTVRAREFYRGLFETTLEPDELVTEVGFPLLGDRTDATYRSFTPRDGDYAVASTAPVVTTDESGTVTDASVTVGAVGDCPEVVEAATDELVGRDAADVSPEAVGERVAEAAAVQGGEEWSESYKRSLLEFLVSDALENVGVGGE